MGQYAGGSDADASVSEQDEFAQRLSANLATAGRVAARHVAASEVPDALQNAPVAAWRARATFNPERGSFRTWFLTIVAHEAHRLARDAVRRRDLAELLAALEMPHRVADPGSGADLAAALETLSERQKQVVGLHYLADLPVVAVAALLQVTEGTVKSTLHDARARLRAALSTSFPPRTQQLHHLRRHAHLLPNLDSDADRVVQACGEPGPIPGSIGRQGGMLMES